MSHLRKVIPTLVNNKPRKSAKPIVVEATVKAETIEVLIDTKTDEEVIESIIPSFDIIDEVDDTDLTISKETLDIMDESVTNIKKEKTKRRHNKKKYTTNDN